MKTRTLIPGYYNNEEDTARLFVDGWYYQLADLAHLSHPFCFYIYFIYILQIFYIHFIYFSYYLYIFYLYVNLPLGSALVI